MPNTLYYGDNLELLPKYVPPPESVGLVYIDPSSNGSRSYEVFLGEA